MNILTILTLAAIIDGESQRFFAVREQSSDGGCGAASLSSLIALYCGLESSEERVLAAVAGARRPVADKVPYSEVMRTSIADLAAAAEAAGLRVRCRRMSLAELGKALAAGYAPLIVHYDRPDPHFALLLGEAEGLYALADPARGLEALEASEFRARWSGAVLVVDPAAVDSVGRTIAADALRAAVARRHLLEAESLGSIFGKRLFGYLWPEGGFSEVSR